jgi:hypothetical protein
MNWSGELTMLGSTREKGTSWLASLEELGILGSLPLFICIFILLKVIILRKINFNSEREKGHFYGLAGSLIILLFSATTEAWLVAAGAFPFFIFWFTGTYLVTNYAYRNHLPSL